MVLSVLYSPKLSNNLPQMEGGPRNWGEEKFCNCLKELAFPISFKKITNTLYLLLLVLFFL